MSKTITERYEHQFSRHQIFWALFSRWCSDRCQIVQRYFALFLAIHILKKRHILEKSHLKLSQYSRCGFSFFFSAK